MFIDRLGPMRELILRYSQNEMINLSLLGLSTTRKETMLMILMSTYFYSLIIPTQHKVRLPLGSLIEQVNMFRYANMLTELMGLFEKWM